MKTINDPNAAHAWARGEPEHAGGTQLFRFYAVGTRVVRYTYTVRHKYMTWMGPKARDAGGPFAVLTCMSDEEECGTHEGAVKSATHRNDVAKRNGTIQTGTIVVP